MYFVCGVSMTLAAIFAWLCEETKDKTLQDTFEQPGQENEERLQQTENT